MGASDSGKKPGKSIKPERPSIFQYSEYRAFLKDWLKYAGLSKREFSIQAGFTGSYLTMILNRKRPLTKKAAAKCAKVMNLSSSEASYFELLRKLEESKKSRDKIEAIKRIQRFNTYKEGNQNEIQVFRYLTHWFYVAIREMTALSDFRGDPEWISSRLVKGVAPSEVKKALDFLFNSGLIKADNKGRILPPEGHISCMDDIFRLSLGNFQREMLDIAKESIDSVPRERRDITGQTISIKADQIDELKEILKKTRAEIAKLSSSGGQADEIYHVSFSAFPLTSKGLMDMTKTSSQEGLS